MSIHSAYADDIKENITDTDNMLRIIETLSSKARGVNDLERTYAKDFVKNEFQKVGLEVEEQCFEASPMSGEDIKYEGVNIIGKMLPDKQNDSGKVFIVCAHYDGVDGMPAANDNASGVSVMIELARKLRGYTTDTEIRFIAFDAEEVGMVGSKFYIDTCSDIKNIVGVLNFDYDIDKINKESEYDVSQKAQNCWNKIRGIVEDVDAIYFINIFTDGFGGENTGIKISKHNSLKQQIEEFIHSEEMPNLTEFKQLERVFLDGEGINLSIDYLDVLHADGNCYEESNLKKEWSMAKIYCQSEYDKPSDWAVDSIISAIESDIIPFELQNKYKEYITRLEFCKIIYNLMDNIGVEFEKFQYQKSPFIDIECNEISLLYNIGIVNGIDDVYFRPQDNITREQAAAILNRVCRYMGLNVKSSSIFMYNDHSTISDYAVSSVYDLREFEVMFGTEDNLFSPQTQLTREQAITTIVRLKNVLEVY